MLALSNKVNVKLLGVSAGIVGNFLSEHGEDFTPEELVTLSESQAQDMANDIVEHHAEQASSKLLSVTRRNIYSVFAPTVETEGIVERKMRGLQAFFVCNTLCNTLLHPL